MKISKTLLTCALALASMAATAQNYVNFYPKTTTVTVEPGAEFDLVFCLDNSVSPTVYQFKITAPDNFTFAKKGLKYKVTYNDRLDTDVYTTTAVKNNDANYMTYIGYVPPELIYDEYAEYWLQPGEGDFVTVTLKAPTEMGEYTLLLWDVLFDTKDETEYWSPDANITVNVGEPSALPAVSADTTDDAYYDLLGRRIERPTAPGLYIHAGRKVIK